MLRKYLRNIPTPNVFNAEPKNTGESSPLLTFSDSFELLDDIETVLGIRTCPVNWPIGSGKEFKGIYDRKAKTVRTFEAVSTFAFYRARCINCPSIKQELFSKGCFTSIRM